MTALTALRALLHSSPQAPSGRGRHVTSGHPLSAWWDKPVLLRYERPPVLDVTPGGEAAA